MVWHAFQVVFGSHPGSSDGLIDVVQDFIGGLVGPGGFPGGSVFCGSHYYVRVVQKAGSAHLFKAAIYVHVQGLVVVEADALVQQIFQGAANLFQFGLVDERNLHGVHPGEYLEHILIGADLHYRDGGGAGADNRKIIRAGGAKVHVEGGGEFYPSAAGLGNNVSGPSHGGEWFTDLRVHFFQLTGDVCKPVGNGSIVCAAIECAAIAGLVTALHHGSIAGSEHFSIWCETRNSISHSVYASFFTKRSHGSEW